MNFEKKNITFTQIILISFFFGILGIDRLLLGYKNWWLKGITLGGLSVWALLDLVKIVTLKMKRADGSAIE